MSQKNDLDVSIIRRLIVRVVDENSDDYHHHGPLVMLNFCYLKSEDDPFGNAIFAIPIVKLTTFVTEKYAKLILNENQQQLLFTTRLSATNDFQIYSSQGNYLQLDKVD